MKVISNYDILGVLEPYDVWFYSHPQEAIDAAGDFRTALDGLEALPRSESDPTVPPILSEKHDSGDMKAWICPQCSAEVGDQFHNMNQAHGDYCPDCGARIDWLAVSNNMSRTRGFYKAEDVHAILDSMRTHESQEYQETVCKIKTEVSKYEKEYPVKSQEAMAPIYKEKRKQILTNGGENGRLVEYTDQQYDCPACGSFVGTHEILFPYEALDVAHKTKPVKWCGACGQKIRWDGIHLNPEKFDTSEL